YSRCCTLSSRYIRGRCWRLFSLRPLEARICAVLLHSPPRGPEVASIDSSHIPRRTIEYEGGVTLQNRQPEKRGGRRSLMLGDSALTLQEFITQEPLPLATIHDAVLGFLRGREDAVLFGVQAVNAYVDTPRMTQDIDLLSPRAEELAHELRDH